LQNGDADGGHQHISEQDFTNSTEVFSCINEIETGTNADVDNSPRIEEQDGEEEDDEEEDDDDDDDDVNGVFLEDIFIGPTNVEADEKTGKSGLFSSRPPSVSIFHRNRSSSNVEDKVDSGGTTPVSLHSARTATRVDRLEDDDFLTNLQNSLYNMISSDGDQLGGITFDQLVEDALADDDLSVSERESEHKVFDNEKVPLSRKTKRTGSNANTTGHAFPRETVKTSTFPTHRKASNDSLGSSSLLDKSKEEAFFNQDSDKFAVSSSANNNISTTRSHHRVCSLHGREEIIESLRSIEQQINLLLAAQDNKDSHSSELPLILSSMNATTKLNHLLIELSERYVDQQQKQSQAHSS